MHIISRWSAPGLFLVVVVGTLASYDWLMSVEPTWYSTIFGLYYPGRRRADVHVDRDAGLPGIPARRDSDERHQHRALSRSGQVAVRADRVLHLHRVFAIPADLVREHSGRDHLVPRTAVAGSWLYISLAMPFIRFIIPFFMLLCRPAKRNLTIIGLVAVWSLVVEYHRSLLGGDAGLLQEWAADSLAGFRDAGGHGQHLRAGRSGAASGKHKMVPVGDLRFEQSLHFENA